MRADGIEMVLPHLEMDKTSVRVVTSPRRLAHEEAKELHIRPEGAESPKTPPENG